MKRWLQTNTENFQSYAEYLAHSLNINSIILLPKNSHVVLEKIKMTHQSEIMKFSPEEVKKEDRKKIKQASLE